MAGLLRLVTFLAAIAFAALIVLYPRAIAADMHDVSHGSLVLLLLGMCCGWVYGLGFVPENRWLRLAFTPWVAWALMLLGAWRVFLA